jgi:hypothetical protein
MNAKIAILYHFLQNLWPQNAPRRGKPYFYNWPSMLLFFLVMLLKGIYSYKAMASYASQHHPFFGWPTAPSRKTISRRFEALPSVIFRLMPLVAEAAKELDYQVFSFRWAFIDKSVFRAMGGVWHKAHRLLGIVPHKSIDTEASWAKSTYHGWRFGYGLHLVCNHQRFPLACSVTTAATKDVTQLVPLLSQLVHSLGMVVADAGYVALRLLKKLHKAWNLFVLLPIRFRVQQQWQQEYNQLASTTQARLLYRQRKATVEPVFSLIKQIYNLTKENQLPYTGLKKVKPYLMMTAFSVQLMMYYNYINKAEFASTKLLLNDFK